MYLASIQRRLASAFGGEWRRGFMRSGILTGLLLAWIVVALAFAYRERGRGHLHKLESRIVTERQDAPVPRPGGQEAIVLTRSRLAGASTPEFLSLTLLPGRGMNLLQIQAFLPDKGEVGLLDAPTVEQAEAAMNGRGADANGGASLAMGSPFEVPWAGRILGAESAGRVTALWRGHLLSLPVVGTTSEARAGLLLARPADSSDTAGMPDGGQAEATFSAADFGAHWPSKTDVKVTALLTSRYIQLTVTAHNTGDAPEPIGIGWAPRFVLPGARAQMRLRIPGEMRLLKDRVSGAPTGALQPTAGTAYDFLGREGALLGSLDLDETFVRLRQDFLDSGPVTEIRDPAGNYGLRVTTLSNAIRAIHVSARPDAKYISIEPRFNYDDPFGHEWSREEDTGMAVLQPGQTANWQIRLELFSLVAPAAPF
ncbi:MAG: hypothetical protein M3O02_08345 [Acidobacteriota bacterium]|nr:hypothetical protein [Acidobacteriota bacterium]